MQCNLAMFLAGERPEQRGVTLAPPRAEPSLRVDARLSGALNMLSLMRKVVGAATEDDEEVCTSRCLHPDPTPGQDSR